jgi:iron complex outermembrane receptor protein
VYVDVAAFFNRYSNLFSEDIIGAPFLETSPGVPHLLLPAQFGNGLRGTVKGVEIAPEWKPTRFSRIGASYSYLQMDIEKAPHSLDVGTASFVEGGSPKHELTAHSGIDFWKSLSLDLTYRYVSKLPALSIPSYSTGDARFAWRLGPHFTFSVVGRNLFQPFHFEYASDPGPNVAIKRTAYGQITWTQ